MKSGFKITRDVLKKTLDNVKILLDKDVLVGIPSITTERNEEGPVNNATLGYIHDKGSPRANIPARPFMEPGVSAVKEKLVARFKAAGKASLVGDKAGVEQQLNSAGLIAQTSIKSTINEGVPPELSPATIAARKRDGYEGEKPLIRTGQLRNSINYVLRKK